MVVVLGVAVVVGEAEGGSDRDVGDVDDRGVGDSGGGLCWW